MKILVVNCRDTAMWYFKHVGDVLECIMEDAEYYWCYEFDDHTGYKFRNIVKKEEAIKIEE